MKGNVGVIHLVQNETDIDWIVSHGKFSPYIPLLTAEMFTDSNMKRLIESKKISGALVIHADINGDNKTHRPEYFSPDSSCPSENFGMYADEDKYKNCKKLKWNPPGNGMSFVYYGVPIFALSGAEEVAALEECYNKHNYPYNDSNPAAYPLCAVEMKDFMFAAKDTPTCRRKTEMGNPIQSTYCDPLGDYNVVGTLYPITEPPQPNEVIVIGSRIDSTSFFHDISPGADNDVTGITTLLAAAYALGEYKRTTDPSKIPKLKPIMFILFNGEVWDYIGSSKVVFDMERGRFPHASNIPSNSSNMAAKIDLSQVGYFIEVNQLGLGVNGSMWAHTDPISQEDKGVRKEVDFMLKALQNASSSSNVTVNTVDRSSKQPLPPASFQRFLRASKKIPGVVLTDHEKEYANKFYNSRFDTPENIGVTTLTVNESHAKIMGNQSMKLTKLATVLANAIYLLASGGVPPAEPIKVPRNMTANLIYCFLYSANCPGFKEASPESLAQKLSSLKQPFSRYVSVLQLTNDITNLVHNLMGYYLGDWLNVTVCDDEKQTRLPYAVSHWRVQGRGIPKCVRSSAYMTQALSPAFELKDYDSKEYSTWAESMWNSDMGIQMFLIADPVKEGVVLGVGLAVLVVSFSITYFMHSRSSYLFTPDIQLVAS